MKLTTGLDLFVFLLQVNVECKDGQMEIGIEAAEQLSICRLDNDYEMKWRSRRYVFAITQVRGVLYVGGKTILVSWAANLLQNEPDACCLSISLLALMFIRLRVTSASTRTSA